MRTNERKALGWEEENRVEWRTLKKGISRGYRRARYPWHLENETLILSPLSLPFSLSLSLFLSLSLSLYESRITARGLNLVRWNGHSADGARRPSKKRANDGRTGRLDRGARACARTRATSARLRRDYEETDDAHAQCGRPHSLAHGFANCIGTTDDAPFRGVMRLVSRDRNRP